MDKMDKYDIKRGREQHTWRGWGSDRTWGGGG